MFKRVLALTFVFLSLGSCTQKPPYEVRSPCVSTDTENPWAHNPCIRRPLNRDIA